jgi:thiosulfate reductase cytochrome b subunit
MHRIYLHPLPVRIWHWINAVTCVTLFLTGIQIRYVGLINLVSFRTAVAVHNWMGFVLIANFCVWLGFYLFSDKITTYQAELNPLKFFRGCMRQAIYYSWGILVGAPSPFHPTEHRKFNPLQAITYQILMILLLPIQCLTGILLWNLVRFSGAATFFGGVRVVDTVHVLIFIFFAFYIPAHVYLGTLGRTPTTHYKAMFTGYEDVEERERAEEAD